MREIKFKAWDKIYKKIFNWEELSGKAVDLLNYPEYEIMQYTGLTDKNGKEIYEGDLFKIKDFNKEFIYEICWDIKNSGWIYRRNRLPKKEVDWGTREDGKVYKAYQPEYLNIKTLEVIGNIYENPNLLTIK